MHIKHQRDFWAGAMFLLVGAAFALGSLSYSFGSSARPGPGYFPFGLGLLLAALGAIEIFKAVSVASEDEHHVGAFAWKTLVTIVGAVVVFGFTLPWLGMAVALPLLIVISALAGDEFKWHEAILNSIVLTVGSWAVFDWGLNLVIPLWPTFITG